jgi:Uma2 family endonuclease
MSATTSQSTTEVTKQSKKRKIPKSLIRETIDGIPFYYKGFRSVLNKTKKLEEIMADSSLQSLLKKYLFSILLKELNDEKYEPFMGEVGSHLDHRNNMGLDIAVYETKLLTPDKFTTKYFDITPKLVIEIDVNVEVLDKTTNLFEEFVLRKVRQLHAFGTEKIIWIFSKSKTVIVARPDNTWEVLEWDKDVELLDGIKFNIADYLKKRGIL